MKEQLINMLEQNNSTKQGILIPVPLEEYVTKILTYATLIPYISEGNIKAFIAYYNNDPTKQMAFLTMVLVSPEFRGKGIGKLLLKFSLDDLIKSGFKNYSLEVLKSNTNAYALYATLGFEIKEDRGSLWLMNKTIM